MSLSSCNIKYSQMIFFGRSFFVPYPPSFRAGILGNRWKGCWWGNSNLDINTGYNLCLLSIGIIQWWNLCSCLSGSCDKVFSFNVKLLNVIAVVHWLGQYLNTYHGPGILINSLHRNSSINELYNSVEKHNHVWHGVLIDVLELKPGGPRGHTAMTDKPEKCCTECQSSSVCVKNIFVLAESWLC